MPRNDGIFTTGENPKRACRYCRHFIYRRFLLAGKPTEAPSCAKFVRYFPDYPGCPIFEREPGSDDE